MNMKKIMASVAAAALAVSAMATSAFAAGGMWDFTDNAQYVDPAAATMTIAGENLLQNSTSNSVIKFTATKVEFKVPDGYKDAGVAKKTITDADYLKALAVNVAVTYRDAAGADHKLTTAAKNNNDGTYEFTLGTQVTGAVTEAGTLPLKNLNVTKIEVSIDAPAYTEMGNAWKVAPKTVITVADNTSVIDGAMDATNIDTALPTLHTGTYTTTAATLTEGGIIGGKALVAGTKTPLNDVKYFWPMGNRTIPQWVADTIGYNKGAQLKFTFMTAAELEDAIAWNGTSSWGGGFEELPFEGADGATLKDFAIGVNLGSTSMLQANGLIKDNTVTFEWDDIMKSYSSTVGDIETIHVRAKNNVVIKSIEIIIPEQEEIDSEKTDSAEAPEVTGEEGEDTTAELEDPEESDITDGEEGEEGEDTDSSIEDGEGEEGEDTSAEEGDNTGDNGEAGNKGENPTTGVALAIVPAIVAGAAVVISRKRK